MIEKKIEVEREPVNNSINLKFDNLNLTDSAES